MSLHVSGKTLTYLGFVLAVLLCGTALLTRRLSPSSTPVLSMDGATSTTSLATDHPVLTSSTIEVTRGSVFLRRSQENAWHKIDERTQLALGDSVKTGPESAAIIYWGSRGVTSLEAETELTIEQTPIVEDSTKTVTEINLAQGKIWSRFLKLLDIDSSTAIRVNGVVATVRGTSFGIGVDANGLQLAVTDSVVEVSRQEPPKPTDSYSGSTMLGDGMWGLFDVSGMPKVVRYLTDSDVWPNKGQELDQVYDGWMEKQLEHRYQAVTLESAKRAGLDCSEQARVTIEQAVLATLFGDKDIASLEKVGRPTCLTAKDANKVLQTLRLALEIAIHRSTETNDQTALVEALGHLRSYATDIVLGPASIPYSHLLDIDDAVDISKKQDPLKRQALSGKLKTMKDHGTITRQEEEKWNSLNFRLLMGEFHAARKKTPPAAPKRLPVTSIPTEPPLQEQKNGCSPIDASFTIHPISPVTPGTPVTLTVQGTCPDGSMTDLTTQATLSMQPSGLGAIQSAIFTPTAAGSVSLYARIAIQGQERILRQDVRIRTAGRIPVSLQISSTGPTTLTTGQIAPLEAKVSYNDGSTGYVTYECVWSTSDSKKAIIENAKLITLSDPGTVNARCQYSENGVSVDGDLPFIVQLDPALKPTGGTSNPLKTY